jgi:hypothetical protein
MYLLFGLSTQRTLNNTKSLNIACEVITSSQESLQHILDCFSGTQVLVLSFAVSQIYQIKEDSKSEMCW